MIKIKEAKPSIANLKASMETSDLQVILKKQHSVPNNQKQCRICLQHQSQSKKQFIDPCNCIGSVKYVHIECIQQWIKKSIKNLQSSQQNSVQKKTKCQMCKSYIYYAIIRQSRFVNCGEFLQNIKTKKIIFIILSIMVAVIFSSLTFLIYFSVTKPLQFNKDQLLEPIIITVSFIVLTVFLIIGLYFLIDQFLRDQTILVKIIKKNQKSLLRSQSLVETTNVVVVENLD